MAEAETAYMQSDASVRQAELALAKAEADLARLADLFEHQAVAQKEVLAAQTTAALAELPSSRLDRRVTRRAAAWNCWDSRPGSSSSRSTSLPRSQARCWRSAWWMASFATRSTRRSSRSRT